MGLDACSSGIHCINDYFETVFADIRTITEMCFPRNGHAVSGHAPFSINNKHFLEALFNLQVV